MGVFAKDDFSGDFVEQWKAILAKSSLEQVMVDSKCFAVLVRLNKDKLSLLN